MCKGILKTIIPIFAIIIGILSIGIIVIGARLKSNKPVFWDYVGDDYN